MSETTTSGGSTEKHDMIPVNGHFSSFFFFFFKVRKDIKHFSSRKVHQQLLDMMVWIQLLKSCSLTKIQYGDEIDL